MLALVASSSGLYFPNFLYNSHRRIILVISVTSTFFSLYLGNTATRILSILSCMPIFKLMKRSLSHSKTQETTIKNFKYTAKNTPPIAYSMFPACDPVSSADRGSFPTSSTRASSPRYRQEITVEEASPGKVASSH